MNAMKLRADARKIWETSILAALRRHIRIRAKSVDFDEAWYEHGHIAKAIANANVWCSQHAPQGSTIEVIDGGMKTIEVVKRGERKQVSVHRTPVLLIDIPATGGSKETAFLYGHLDKQPEGKDPWDASRGLKPWKPVDIHEVDGHKLYGRGGADDGYAVFAAIAAINCLENQGVAHARCVILVETGEESGSPDLPFYLEMLRPTIGTPSFIAALDSGCGTYDRLWLTNSLRGLVIVVLEIHVLQKGIHSGEGGGVVPDSSCIRDWIVQEIRDARTGRFLIPEFHANISEAILEQARITSETIGEDLITRYHWAGTPPTFQEDANARSNVLCETVLNRTWRPALTETGVDGLPAVKDAGNVLRAMTRTKLSIRIPPTVDHALAAAALDRVINSVVVQNPQARITHTIVSRSSWLSPPEAPWLTQIVNTASQEIFDQPAGRMGEGGAIPFMAQLTEAYPQAQFVISGVLGKDSNAHGPDEMLHVDYAINFTAAMAHMLGAHAAYFMTKAA